MKLGDLCKGILFGIVVAAGAGCGDNASGVTCATGTTLVDDQCVPDGSVICETGTTYNAETGTCVPDVTGCGEGTVLIEGECVPEDDALVADVEEPAEPNDGSGTPGEFETPANPGDTVTIKGCITPADFDGDGALDADFDGYLFEVSEPALLDITVDGLGGLAGAFEIAPGDEGVFNAGWFRRGLNLVNDTSQRQVFLPKAGLYALFTADSRTLLEGNLEAAGDADTCYFATVERVELPTPTPLTTATVTGDLDTPQFFSVAPERGGLMVNVVSEDSAAAVPDIVQLLNGAYAGSSNGAEPASQALLGLEETDDVVLVVDHFEQYGLNVPEFTLEAAKAQEVPEDGAVTITHNPQFFRFLFFEGSAGDVVRLDMTSDTGEPLLVDLVDAQLQSLGLACDECTGFGEWALLPADGLYYLRVFNLADSPSLTYEVSVSRSHQTPTPITVDTAITDDTTDANAVAFYTLDVSAKDWLFFAGDTAEDLTFGVFDRTGAGFLGSEVPELDGFDLSANAEAGRIYSSDQSLLVQVTTSAPAATFDLSVGDRQPTDLGAVIEGTPVTADGESLAADEIAYYLVEVAPTDKIAINANPTGPLVPIIELLSATEEVTASSTGVPATLLKVVEDETLFAFQVRGDATAGDFDLEINATAPTTHSSAPDLSIPDANGPVTDVITATDQCSILGISVDVDISHTYRGDVILNLTSPSNTVVELKSANFFDAGVDVVGNFPGTLVPVDDLGALFAEPAPGDWTLSVSDAFGGDTGTLNSWAINLHCL